MSCGRQRGRGQTTCPGDEPIELAAPGLRPGLLLCHELAPDQGQRDACRRRRATDVAVALPSLDLVHQIGQLVRVEPVIAQPVSDVGVLKAVAPDDAAQAADQDGDLVSRSARQSIPPQRQRQRVGRDSLTARERKKS